MAKIERPVNPSLPPPVHQLEWSDFERLTVDMFENEDGVATTGLHGDALPGHQTVQAEAQTHLLRGNEL